MMEIMANKAAKLGVPALNVPIQMMFAEAEGWVQKWSQDRMVREEKAAGMAWLGVPGLSTALGHHCPVWIRSRPSRLRTRCSAATFPGCTTPLLTSHATFLQVSFPYPSTPTTIRSDLRPSAVIPYPLLRICISTARILCILCPILVHVCSGSSVSFSPFFLHCFILLYLCLLCYLPCVCPGIH
jgi:hypothetical protein